MENENDIENTARPDKSIQAEIWDALWNEDLVRLLDMNNLMVQVKDGEVTLKGHLARKNNSSLIERVVRPVPGVTAIHNYLVSDDTLRIQVAQALFQDSRTRHLIIPVGVDHGWVRLGGEVPTCEIQFIAEEIAGQVPAVRGIIALPRVAGEKSWILRAAVQPRIGSLVYDKDGGIGHVSQVVIQPHNRLVTDVVVDTEESTGEQVIKHRWIVPVQRFHLVTKDSLLLKRDGPPLSMYPACSPDDYGPAPAGWTPPYPYAADEVCWPSGQIPAEKHLPKVHLEIKLEAEIKIIHDETAERQAA